MNPARNFRTDLYMRAAIPRTRIEETKSWERL